jgi:hypothetical protein
VALRLCPVTLRPPQPRTAERVPAGALGAVQVRDVAPPAGVEPSAWRWWTTVAVQTVADAIARVTWYACRWGMERVETHMTQGGGCTLRARGHHRADVHLCIVDDDAINAPCHPVSALRTGHGVACGVPALAKRLPALGSSHTMDLLLCLGIALPPVLPQALLGRGHLLPFALARLTREHLCQVSIAQPRLLACTLREDVTPRVASCRQRLGQPGAPRRPLPCMGAQTRRPQDPAAVRPDQCVHGLSGGRAGRAARALGAPPRLGATTPTVIMRAGA